MWKAIAFFHFFLFHRSVLRASLVVSTKPPPLVKRPHTPSLHRTATYLRAMATAEEDVAMGGASQYTGPPPPPPPPHSHQPPPPGGQPPPVPAGAGAEFFLSNYRLGKTLGIGSFGKVRRESGGRRAAGDWWDVHAWRVRPLFRRGTPGYSRPRVQTVGSTCRPGTGTHAWHKGGSMRGWRVRPVSVVQYAPTLAIGGAPTRPTTHSHGPRPRPPQLLFSPCRSKSRSTC